MAATAPKPMARPVGFLIEQYWGRGIFFCTRCSLLNRFILTGRDVSSADLFRLQLQGFLTVKKSISSSYSWSISSFKRTIEPGIGALALGTIYDWIYLAVFEMRRYYPRLSVIINWERFLVFSPFFSFCDEARHWWQADTDRGCSVFRCKYKYKYEYKYKWKYKYKHNYKRSTAVTSRHRSRLVSVQAQSTTHGTRTCIKRKKNCPW